jgi:hypothetical protein
MPNSPEDPFTLLQAGATQLHEFTKTLEESGYSHQDALYLTGQTIIGSIIAQNKPPNG